MASRLLYGGMGRGVKTGRVREAPDHAAGELVGEFVDVQALVVELGGAGIALGAVNELFDRGHFA